MSRTGTLGYGYALPLNGCTREGILRAITFDFNGVIADDEMSHLECFQQALSEAGLALSKDEYYGTYLGMDEQTCAAALLKRRDGTCDHTAHARIIERKATLFRNHTATHRAALFPWVIGFVKRAAGRYRLASRRAAGGNHSGRLSLDIPSRRHLS